MKKLMDRTEIAKAINFHTMPVVKLDLADSTQYGIKSAPVLIDNGTFRDGRPYYINSRIEAFTDSKKFAFSGECVSLSSSFGYSDLEDMLDYANAPIVKADSDFVLVVIDSNKRNAFPPQIMHTSKTVNAFCTTALRIVDEDNDAEMFISYAQYNGYIKG